MGLGEIGERWSQLILDEQNAYPIEHWSWIGKRSIVLQKTQIGTYRLIPIADIEAHLRQAHFTAAFEGKAVSAGRPAPSTAEVTKQPNA